MCTRHSFFLPQDYSTYFMNVQDFLYIRERYYSIRNSLIELEMYTILMKISNTTIKMTMLLDITKYVLTSAVTNVDYYTLNLCCCNLGTIRAFE